MPVKENVRRRLILRIVPTEEELKKAFFATGTMNRIIKFHYTDPECWQPDYYCEVVLKELRRNPNKFLFVGYCPWDGSYREINGCLDIYSDKPEGWIEF